MGLRNIFLLLGMKSPCEWLLTQGNALIYQGMAFHVAAENQIINT